jgi:Prokaryotic cytochrome b561
LRRRLLPGLGEIVFGPSGVPLTDSLMIYPPFVAHVLFALLFVGFIILHVLVALYHQFVKKDGLLLRMSFGRRVSDPSAPVETVIPTDPARG